MLLRTLPRFTKYKPVVITLNQAGSLAPEFKKAGIEVTSVGIKGFLDWKGIKRLRAQLKHQNPAIVFTYLFYADMIGRLFLQPWFQKRPPLVIPFLRTTYNSDQYRIARLTERLTRGLARAYLANSESVKQYYHDHMLVSKSKITVIPNGIDLEVYKPDQKLRERLRQEFKINPQDLALICVANLHPYKGQSLILTALHQIADRVDLTKIHLLLVGDGAERQSLETTAEELSLPNIHFLGRRSDVPNLLKLSDIFVFPTHFEGMPNALMEAMAANLPAIASDIPENRCLIQNQQNGLLFETKNSTELAKVLIQILTDDQLRQSLGNAAKETIQSQYGIDQIVKSWESYIQAHL